MKLCQSHYAAAHPSCSHAHTIIHCYDPTQWLVLIGGTFQFVCFYSCHSFLKVFIFLFCGSWEGNWTNGKPERARKISDGGGIQLLN